MTRSKADQCVAPSAMQRNVGQARQFSISARHCSMVLDCREFVDASPAGPAR
jgi:hypothetical protein